MAFALLIQVIAVGWPNAGDAESASPVSANLSRERLERVGDFIRQEIATGKIDRLDGIGSYRAGNKDRARPVLFSGRYQRVRSWLCRAHRGACEYIVAVRRISQGRCRRPFFFIDPRHDMFAIFMMQAPSQSGRIQLALKTLIYKALRN
jgi:hypothetical protein